MAEQDRVVRNGEDILLPRAGRNILDNGDCFVRQRGTTFTSTSPATGGNNDGSYTYDRWFILSDGNDVIDIDGGVLNLDIETANKKFGIAQIVENANAVRLQGLPLTFSFRANWQVGAVDHVKAAIVGWTGTADAPTRDFISSWNADDTLPTLTANWAFLNSPDDLNVTNSTEVYTVTATPTSSHRNLAVFVWSDSTSSTVGNVLRIQSLQLEVGLSNSQFELVNHADQLARCQRYYEVLRYNSLGQAAISSLYSGSQSVHTWYYKAEKFKTPTVTLATGSWSVGTPTITAATDHTYLNRVAGAFFASGTSGNVALAADAGL